MLAGILAAVLMPACPVQGVLTSGYGRRLHPVTGRRSMHRGVDLGAPEGSQILSALGGVVEHVGESPTWGRNVVVRSHTLRIRYAHARSILVGVGEVLVRGAPLGEVGSTGRATGPHLHLEVVLGRRWVDPSYMLANCRR